MTVICFLFILWHGSAFGSTLHVPGQYPSIQAAINGADHGDTVLVGNGTYSGPGNSNLDLMGKAIVLKSENGSEKCIIDGQGSARGFYFQRGEGADTVVSGFTIINGYATQGGAIYCASSPTITHCTIRDSRADLGGGLFCQASSPIITSCRVIGNDADFGGGGMAFFASSSPTMTHCEISENVSNFGGGGGIYVHESSPIITACTITANRGDQGGGIHCQKSSPTITRCRIHDNTAHLGGGGISCETDSSPSITNCLVTENIADFGGGGIYCRNSSSPTIIHCTISGNIAALWNGVNWGGAILSESSSSPIMTNSIVWGNVPNQWVAIDSSTPLVTYSDIQGGFPGDGNINSNPSFVGQKDYQLNPNSPCIDKGSPFPGNDHTAIDYLGNSRPQGAGWDMGAYESMGTVTPANCPECSGVSMVLEKVTFASGTTCECECTESITIGNEIRVESGASVTIRAPKVYIKAAFQAENGAVVKINQK